MYIYIYIIENKILSLLRQFSLLKYTMINDVEFCM
jgi:hypothetical protein